MSIGIGELLDVLQTLQTELELDATSADLDLPDGHTLTIRVLAGGLVEFERDDSRIVIATGAAR
jgi:hypothetical protein